MSHSPETKEQRSRTQQSGPDGSQSPCARAKQTAQVRSIIEQLWARGIGSPGFLPTRKEMVAAGERALYDVLTSLGGLDALAESLGVRRQPGSFEVTAERVLSYLKARSPHL